MRIHPVTSKAPNQGCRLSRLKLILPVFTMMVSSLFLAGCSARIAKQAPEQSRLERSIEQRMVLTHSGSTYQGASDKKYVLPEPSQENPKPRFPQLKSDAGGVTTLVSIAVTLIVDEKGRVIDVRPHETYTSDKMSPFLEQVILACRQWSFTPLQARTTRAIPDGTAFGQPKVKIVTDVENLPFSLEYEFQFSETETVKEVRKDWSEH